MNKALKRKVNNISVPVEIHRDEWLMLFCIHLIFKSTALFWKVVSRSEWHSKRAEINYKNCVALFFFGCECWADCTQAAILRHFIATWELCGEGSTNIVLFFHTSCFVSALPSAFLWAAKHQIHCRAALLQLCLGSHIPLGSTWGSDP